MVCYTEDAGNITNIDSVDLYGSHDLNITKKIGLSIEKETHDTIEGPLGDMDILFEDDWPNEESVASEIQRNVSLPDFERGIPPENSIGMRYQ
jgi:hypothetical protein